MTLDDRQAAIALQVGQGRITLEVGRKRVFDTLHLPRSQSAALSGHEKLHYQRTFVASMSLQFLLSYCLSPRRYLCRYSCLPAYRTKLTRRQSGEANKGPREAGLRGKATN